MGIARGTGRITGVVIEKTKASPGKTKRRLTCMTSDFKDGFKAAKK